MNPKKSLKQLKSWKDLQQEWMQDPEFVAEWKKIEPEYQVARQIIKARLAKHLTQQDLARKMGTGQAVISRLESMNSRPSLALLQRAAQALDTTITLVIR